MRVRSKQEVEAGAPQNRDIVMVKKPKKSDKTAVHEDEEDEPWQDEEEQQSEPEVKPPEPEAPVEECITCHYYRNGECHRNAPSPYDSVAYFTLKVLTDISRSQEIAANVVGHPLLTEADMAAIVDAGSQAKWPKVQPTDWCGAWYEI